MAPPQPALSMNMGTLTNVDSPITFSFNALTPTEVTNLSTETQSLGQPLASNPASPLRKTILRNTGMLDKIPAQRLAESVSINNDGLEVT